MVLLSCMSALSEEQMEGMVEYASDAITPDSQLQELITRHESHSLQQAADIIEKVGGKVHGHHIRHAGGSSVDQGQFEVFKHISEI